MSFASPCIDSSSPDRARSRRRHHYARGLSVLIHLLMIGVLWSAQYTNVFHLRLAGDRGSIALEASPDRPTTTEVAVLERASPVQVRIEPDHRHVDEQVFVSAPQIMSPRPPTTVEAEAGGATPHAHPHHHHPHEHPTELLTKSVVAEAAAASAAGHEKLPAPFVNPPPEYPTEAHRAKIEGTTVVRIGIRADGTVEFVEVAQSSGSQLLDEAAVRALRTWRFTPGLSRGIPSAYVLRLPIVFKL